MRSKGPDDCRIPSSVFERTKSTAPVEWSVASNESLFSIHAGNSSFSRDYLFLSGMSGELPNLPISPGPQDPADGLRAAAKAEAMKDVPGDAALGHGNGSKLSVEGNRHSASTSSHSIASNQSFAFPVYVFSFSTPEIIPINKKLTDPICLQICRSKKWVCEG